MSPLDLHVLGTPPAFVLSQDQTLSFNPFIRIPSSRLGRSLSELTVVLSCVSLYRFQGSAPLSQGACISYQISPALSSLFLPFFRDFLKKVFGALSVSQSSPAGVKPLSHGLRRDSSPSRGALGRPSRFRGLALRSCLPCWRKVLPLRQECVLEPIGDHCEK